MKKIKLTHIIAAMLIVSMVPLGSAMASERQAVVLAEALPTYEQPNRASAVVATLNSGETVEILDEAPGWFRVTYAADNNTGTGYVEQRFVVRDPQSVLAVNPTFVYAMPDTFSQKVGEMSIDRQLTVIGEWGDFWVISIAGGSGFVLKQDVSYSGEVNQPTQQPTWWPTASARPTQTIAPHPMPTVDPVSPIVPPIGVLEYQVVGTANLYDGPSTTSNMVGVLSKGAIITLSQTREGFGKVSGSGNWIQMKDIELYYSE